MKQYSATEFIVFVQSLTSESPSVDSILSLLGHYEMIKIFPLETLHERNFLPTLNVFMQTHRSPYTFMINIFIIMAEIIILAIGVTTGDDRPLKAANVPHTRQSCKSS